MSARLFQRRELDHSAREQLIDKAFARYLDWRAESDAAASAYEMWSAAPRTEGALRFAAYSAALDREEHAAIIYRSLVDRIEIVSGEERLAGVPRRGVRA